MDMTDQESREALTELGFKPYGPNLWVGTTTEGHIGHIARFTYYQPWSAILYSKGATVHTPPIASYGPIENPVAAATWLLIESASHG